MMRLKQSFNRLKVLFGNSAYGKCELPAWVKTRCGFFLRTILRPIDVEGFKVLPKRWIVERTFAWLGRYRRLSKDYERLTEHSEAIVKIATVNLTLRRLTR